MKKITMIASAIPVLFLAACSSHHREGKETTRSTYDSNNVMNSQKSDYIRSTNKHLVEIEAKIEGWKLEAKDASGSLKENRYESISSLEQKLDKARRELNQLKVASAADYEDQKEEVDEAIKALDTEFRDVANKFM